MSADRPRRQYLRSADRRRQLLDVAAELVVEKGLRGITMQAVADAAGVNRAVAYQQFANSEALLVALLDREGQLLGARITASLVVTTKHEDRLPAVVHEFFEFVGERPAMLPFLVQPPSKADAVGREREAGNEQTREFVAWLIDPDEALPRKQRRVLVEMLLSATGAAMAAWLMGGCSQRAAEELVCALVRGGTAEVKASRATNRA